MGFDELKDPQLQARLRNAKSPEEVLEIAKDCGMELEDAELESVSGGAWCSQYCTNFHYCPSDSTL